MMWQQMIINSRHFQHTSLEQAVVSHESKNVQNAFKEMKKREEQLKNLHDREQLVRENSALKRKEEIEQNIKSKILSANR